MKIACLVTLFLFFIGMPVFAQNDQFVISSADSITNEGKMFNAIIIGGGFNESGIAEIGFGRAMFRPTKYLLGENRKYLQEEYMVGQLYVSSEFVFYPNKMLIAPKIGMNMGISFVNFSYSNFLYYTDFKEGAFSYRPEIGVSLWGGRLYYGYNIPISNKDFLKNNRHQIGLNCLIKIGKIQSKQSLYNKLTKQTKEICK